MNHRLYAVGVTLFLGFSWAHAQPQYFVDQPANKRSTLIGINDNTITDLQFANMAKGLLLKNGNANVRGATFLFAQCYSGGMLDDLNDTFGSEVRWVGGSAARYDELSWGQANSAPYPLDFWPKALYEGFDIAPVPPFFNGPNMIGLVNFARDNDVKGPNGSGSETPQSIYRNGGETINHRESIPASGGGHNAILWAGKADGERHVNDIKEMYQRLSADFQATGDPWSIIVLGDEDDLGIPALPATKANLQAAFNALEAIQGPDDNFLFFASNHGGSDTIIDINPNILGLGDILSRRFVLSPVDLEGILGTPDAMPGILLDIDGEFGRGLRVFVDGIELDDPFDKRDSLGQPYLCIDRDILRRLGPDVEVRFENRTGDRIIINEIAFRTGAITNAVPEASSFALAGLAILLLLMVSRSTRKAIG